MNVYLTISRTTNCSPLLISIPHSGTKIPKSIQNRINQQAKRIHTDWQLDLFVKDFPFTTITSKLSRYVVDVNRSKYSSKNATFPNMTNLEVLYLNNILQNPFNNNG